MAKVTLTVEEALQVLGGLDDVLQAPLKGKLVFRLGWIQRKLLEVRKTFEEVRSTVFDAYAVDGKVPPEQMREFQKEVQEQLSAEVSLELEPIEADKLEAAIEAAEHTPKAQSLILLMPILTGLE